MVNELIEQTTELTERQKEILVDAHFSQDFDSLDRKQKESIIKIEMLLTYLEDKYGEEFIYDKFYTNDEGTLVAHARNDRKSRTFQAWLHWDEDKEEYYYTDAYEQIVVASDKYEALFKQFMDENYPAVEYFVDIKVAEYDENNGEVSTENAGASVGIIIRDCFENKTDYENFLNNVGTWMHNDKYGGSLFCMVMNDTEYNEANYYNYTRLMREKKYIYTFRGDVGKDGNVRIRSRENEFNR